MVLEGEGKEGEEGERGGGEMVDCLELICSPHPFLIRGVSSSFINYQT